MMTLQLLSPFEKDRYGPAIRELLTRGDREFVPPLSARNSTKQAELSGGEPLADGILSYYNELMTQEILAALEGESLLGFVSFRKDYTDGRITERPNLYISTLLLAPEARGKGLTMTLYDELFFRLYPNRSVFTRTWSTNTAHVKILNRFSFEEYHRIQNHRGAGIDTVYYRRPKEQL